MEGLVSGANLGYSCVESQLQSAVIDPSSLRGLESSWAVFRYALFRIPGLVLLSLFHIP